MVGLSGTPQLGLSGTESTVYREPKWGLRYRYYEEIRPLNSPNKESHRFLLTPAALDTPPGGSGAGRPGAALDGDPPLTHVRLTWRKGEHEDWLRFGRPVAHRLIDRHTRIESYAPGQLFALVRWAGGPFGTLRSTLAIVRAVGRGERYTTLPQVDPGGDILLAVRSWTRVRAVLALIDGVEQAGVDPCASAPEYWRHCHNRLAAGLTPRAYRQRRHRAWLQRIGLGR